MHVREHHAHFCKSSMVILDLQPAICMPIDRKFECGAQPDTFEAVSFKTCMNVAKNNSSLYAEHCTRSAVSFLSRYCLQSVVVHCRSIRHASFHSLVSRTHSAHEGGASREEAGKHRSSRERSKPLGGLGKRKRRDINWTPRRERERERNETKICEMERERGCERDRWGAINGARWEETRRVVDRRPLHSSAPPHARAIDLRLILTPSFLLLPRLQTCCSCLKVRAWCTA